MSIQAAEESMMHSQHISIRMVCLAQKPPHAVGWVWEPKKVIQPMGESRQLGPPTNDGTDCCG